MVKNSPTPRSMLVKKRSSHKLPEKEQAPEVSTVTMEARRHWSAAFKTEQKSFQFGILNSYITNQIRR